MILGTQHGQESHLLPTLGFLLFKRQFNISEWQREKDQRPICWCPSLVLTMPGGLKLRAKNPIHVSYVGGWQDPSCGAIAAASQWSALAGSCSQEQSWPWITDVTQSPKHLPPSEECCLAPRLVSKVTLLPSSIAPAARDGSKLPFPQL